MIEALIDSWPPFTFCCPQAIVDQEAEVSIPNLISLLPLDEVPVHAPLRRPRPLRFERLRVPVWNPYSRGRLGPAKSEDRKGGEGKADANLTIFLAPTQRLAPQLAATPWGGSPPRPLCQKICYSDCTENCPLCPLRAPRRFRNPKIGQQLGAQPTPRFRVMSDAIIEAMSDEEIEALIDTLPPITFCRPHTIGHQ